MPGFTIGPMEERVPGTNNARVQAFTSTGGQRPLGGQAGAQGRITVKVSWLSVACHVTQPLGLTAVSPAGGVPFFLQGWARRPCTGWGVWSVDDGRCVIAVLCWVSRKGQKEGARFLTQRFHIRFPVGDPVHR